MTLQCLIIDDEPLARDILLKFVEATADLTLIASCKDAIEATELLNTRPDIDLMFLDINMPKVSGIHFLKSLVQPPAVIFTTAYPKYAVDGFELNAVDYLLKPFTYERFQVAVEKARDKKGQHTIASQQNVHLLIKSNKILHKVNPLDIIYIEAYGDYVKVHLEDQQIITNSTFTAMLTQLKPYQFIRIHKSFAINMQRVQKVQGNQVWVAQTMVPIGQKYKTDFLKTLGS